jgi:hypothetical protein
MMKTYKFKTEIKKHPKVNSAYIEFPYSVEEEFGTKGQVKVRVEFNGYEYRGSLAKMGHHCHCVGITQEVRKTIDKEPGDFIQVVLTKDESPRVVEAPEDLAALFNNNLAAKKYFDDLSYTHKKEYVEWIVSAKKAETRERRLKKTIEMLTSKVKHP